METLLNLVIFFPLAGVLLLLLTKEDEWIKRVSLGTAVATFLLSLPLLFQFDINASHSVQFLTEGTRISENTDIKYLMGLDGLSLLLFMLTTFMGPLVIISSWNSVKKSLKGYHAMLLILQTASLGVFASLDLFVFYIFFELSLIPMYFLIGIWGGEGRIYATLKFFIYTLAGSLIMLVALIYLGFDAGSAMQGAQFTTDWRFISGTIYQPGLVVQTWMFLAFALAFSIKVPLFPFHTWLPFAHTEAPTAGSVVLAAIMLKLGTYGLIRVNMSVFPNAFIELAPYFAVLAVIGIIYGALVAMVQKDIKKLVAYSSVSHLGFVVLGIFAFNDIAIQGAIIQMINHGLSTGALFLIVGMIYDRRHTRLIADFGGIAKSVPVLAVFFLITTMASIGLPGLNGFVGEFFILIGAFNSNLYDQTIYAVLAATGVILAAVYMLWMYQRVMFGPLTQKENREMKDLEKREVGILLPLVFFMIWIGVRPADFTKFSEGWVKHHIEQTTLKGELIITSRNTDTEPDWTQKLYDLSADEYSTKYKVRKGSTKLKTGEVHAATEPTSY